MFVTLDGKFYGNFPCMPTIGAIVIVDLEPRTIIDVVIDAAGGSVACKTEPIVSPQQSDSDVQTRAKDVQPGKHRPGKRH